MSAVVADGGSHARRWASASGRRDVVVWMAVAWLTMVVGWALTAPWLPIPDPVADIDLQGLGSGVLSPGHPLGTDELGRDLLARLVFGARVSLVVGFASVLLGALVGGAIGVTAGYVRGVGEQVSLGIVEIMLAFPPLVLAIAATAIWGRTLPVVTMAMAVITVPAFARVTHAATLATATQEYVLAARVMGSGNVRTVVREVLPNVLFTVLTYGIVTVGVIIVAEGGLSFLGLSVQDPTPSWGSMIVGGKGHLETRPHISLVPATAMFLTVVSLNLVGERLRGHLDQREAAL